VKEFPLHCHHHLAFTLLLLLLQLLESISFILENTFHSRQKSTHFYKNPFQLHTSTGICSPHHHLLAYFSKYTVLFSPPFIPSSLSLSLSKTLPKVQATKDIDCFLSPPERVGLKQDIACSMGPLGRDKNVKLDVTSLDYTSLDDNTTYKLHLSQ